MSRAQVQTLVLYFPTNHGADSRCRQNPMLGSEKLRGVTVTVLTGESQVLRSTY
jgi:hypothetical protein